ncbi:partial cyclic beta-1,2-glucan synthetase, partial [Anaerolineae bacterium]
MTNHSADLALFDYLETQEELFRKATLRLGAPSGKEALSGGAEWILDNYYLVQQTCRQIREDMPPGFYRQLPQVDDGPLIGYARVYAIAQKLIAMDNAQFALEHAQRFLQVYQNFAPLTIGELWALPVMLRLGLIELLAQAVSRLSGLPRNNPLRGLPLRRALSDDAIVATCITSLRTLAAQDWQTFFESVSWVEQILRTDPAEAYARMDRETRDRYRKVIEELAFATGAAEQAVAHEAIEWARANALTPRTTHVGYYLVDEGRVRLETQLGYCVPLRARWRRWVLRHPTRSYLGRIGVLALLIVLGGMSYAQAAGGDFLQWLVVSACLLIPALTLSVNFINWIVTRTIPPRVLPKMDFETGIPSDAKTMVVV